MTQTVDKTPFQIAAEAAEAAWEPRNGGATKEGVWVNAEARTGSRYSVFVNRIPRAAAGTEGGHYLVTLLQPIQSAMVVYDLEELHLSYVLEKLMPVRRPLSQMHGGDAVAIQKTVNYALAQYSKWTELDLKEEHITEQYV